MSLVSAFKWSLLTEVASRAIQPLVFILLARLLSPEDYGVVAAAAMVISFSAIFWEAGMSKALIQHQGNRNEAANVVFWVNLTLSLGVALALVVASDLIAARIFHDARVSSVLKVMSLQVIFSAVVSAHSALLQKDMRFKRLFWIRMTTVGVPGLISIPLAWAGMGYWALIWGTLAGQLVQIPLLWSSLSWRPAFSMDWTVARSLSRFGGWVATTGVLLWFYTWADSLVVGMYLGAHELGLFRTGSTFVILIFTTLFGPVTQVLYSHFSNIQNDRARVRETLIRVIRIITFIAVPSAIMLFANAGFIATTVFGSKWTGVEIVIGIIGLMQGYSWIVGINGEAYRAVGAPSYETKIVALALVFYLVGYWWSIRYGFVAFLWTRLGLSLGSTIIHFWVAKQAVGLPIWQCLRYVLRVTAVCAPVAALSLWWKPVGLPAGAALAGITLAWVLGGLWVLERNGQLRQLIGMLKRGPAAA